MPNRIEKPPSIRGSSVGSPARILRERFGNLLQTKSQGARSKRFSSSSFATGSDGFVDTELSIQYKKRYIKPRISNRARPKRSWPCSGGLDLVCGHLPAPPVRYCEDVSIMAEEYRHVGGHTSPQAPTRVDRRQRLSQHALTEIWRAINEREHREGRDHSLRQHQNIIPDRLLNVTASTRRTSEDAILVNPGGVTSSEQPDNYDGQHVHSTSQLSSAFPSGPMRNLVESTSYFEGAKHKLDAGQSYDS